MKNPAEIRAAAESIGERFRTGRSYERHPENPLGPYSSQYYQAAMNYADALESKDKERVEAAKQQIQDVIDDIEHYETPIRGASTGLGQAISTLDRAKDGGVQVQSIDYDKTGEGKSPAADIADDSYGESWLDPEVIKYILDLAIKHDLQALVDKSPKYKQVAIDNGAKIKDKRIIIGGPMTVQELRYLIRTLGPLGENYPGKGVVRSNTHIPRDSTVKGTSWWMPGEDPEIEPVSDGMWKSYWSRRGYQPMGPTAIADEMVREAREFIKFGIPSARAEKVKGGATSVVSKVAVSNTVKAGRVKLKILAMIHKEETGHGEANRVEESKMKRHPILESVNNVDKTLIAETCETMIRKIDKIISEESPPGWSGTVKAMKKHKEIDNPFALAWSMHKKGAKPHKKPEKSTDESMMKPVSVLEHTV